MSRLNLPRFMKPNDLAAQFGIQFTGFDGKLDDIGVFALVRQSFAAMRLIVLSSHQLDGILDNPVQQSAARLWSSRRGRPLVHAIQEQRLQRRNDDE